MPTTLQTFKTRLYDPLGRSDTTADNIITRGVNFACLCIAMLYDPPELHTTGTLSVLSSGTSVSLSTLTRLAVVKRVYNETAAGPVHMVPFKDWDVTVPEETGSVRFYTKEGSTLYVKPAPSVTNVLTAYYSQFPLVVSNNSDEISFSNFDPEVESYALSYAFMCLEEAESAQGWLKLGETLAVPQQLLLKARQAMEGSIYGNNV